MKLIHYLIVYDLRNRRLRTCEAFGDADQAIAAYSRLERENVGNAGLEVVLLGSDSLDTLRITHGHYFADGEPSLPLPELTAP